MLYLVTQRPKIKYRGAMSTSFAIVEATTGAAAIRKAKVEHADYIGDTPDCRAPEVQELREGIRGYI